MNITEFLEARISEDEAAAQKLALTDRRPVLSIASTVNHPARVLAECAAKRAIIERVSPGDGPAPVRDLVILLILASVYKDHPDYQEAWAVGG